MKNQALIIFARNPVPGKVKTRIAKDLGDEAALAIYKKLLAHTQTITLNLKVDKYIFYADFINDDDLWNDSYSKYLQQGDDLGERMMNAFEYLFNKGYRQVAIIGSDCFNLNIEIIEQAFHNLKETDFTIGPSEDGGYYLLGMNTFFPKIFLNKKWSTDAVFFDSVNDIQSAGYTYKSLPTLSDVDTAEDYKKYSDLLDLSS